jgi:hypothetical protein
VFIRYPNGIEVAGDVVEIDPPIRIVFTYGFVSGAPIPVGASQVTIRLSASSVGTRVTLRHEFAETAARDAHVQGWRYQLSVFANVVGAELAADAARLVDGWMSAWSEADVETRRTQLASIAEPGVVFRDRFSLVSGMDDLMPHLTAAQRFMPGLQLVRRGDVRQCQGTLLADWVARAADGREVAAGTNVFVLSPDGRLAEVTGFWTQAG